MQNNEFVLYVIKSWSNMQEIDIAYLEKNT